MLALAALSSRWLAGWAAADGTPAIALDVFGDADTRAAAHAWYAIGAPGGVPRIDAAKLVDALDALARRGAVDALVAGSGFEAEPELLARIARGVRLLGTAADDQCRIGDARAFFGFLDAHAIVHPPVAFGMPPGSGWLRKRMRSAGGYGVWRETAAGPAPDGVYWQRERPGPAFSATFVANGDAAVVLGFNRQACAAQADLPFVFAGVAGPVAVPAHAAAAVTQALAQLVPAYRLRGLGSIDFMLADEGTAEIIEVNPRPSASAALYPRIDGASPLAAHLRACRDGTLPRAWRGPARALRIVHARHALRLGTAAAQCIAASPGAHDLPAAGARFGAGEPLCTLEAEGDDVAALEAGLVHAASRLLDRLERLEALA